MPSAARDIEHLLRSSWHSYKRRFGSLAIIALCNTIIFASAAVACGAAALRLTKSHRAILWGWVLQMVTRANYNDPLSGFPTHDAVIAGGIFLLAALLLYALHSILTATLWRGVLHEHAIPLHAAYTEGLYAAPRIALLGLIKFFAIVVGIFFLIVPGILFAGWFMFAEICALKGDSAPQSLRTSAGLIAGRWWRFVIPAIFGYLFFIVPLYIVRAVIGLTAAPPWTTVVVLSIAAYFALPWYRVFKKILFDEAKQTVTPLPQDR